MRLYTVEYNGRRRIGAEVSGRLVDLGAAHAAAQAHMGRAVQTGDMAALSDMLALIQSGDAGLKLALEAIAFAQTSAEPVSYALDQVGLLAPIPRPGKILCSGVNYQSHVDENPGAKLPETPFFFAKLPNTVIGPGAAIVKPKMTQQLDYEVELAVVIGRTMRQTPESEVMASIAGYTILHDVSARDVQFKDGQITLGKNFDTFAPLGPCLVTADEIKDPSRLRLRAWVNGRIMQDGSTQDWVFPLPRLLSFLSHVMTLEPGDIVSTGTPAGVGVFRQPPVFLKPGDRVVLEVEGIGRLENPVVGE